MITPSFSLGSYIKLVSGKKSTDKQIIQYNGRVIMPIELAKLVLLLLQIEDDKWKKPRFQGGDMFENYLKDIMSTRQYQAPPHGAQPRSNYQDHL